MWLTDRSRYTDGTARCAMKRYMTYHSGPYGYGMVRKAVSMPLTSGIYVHLALANVMRHARMSQLIVEKVNLRKVEEPGVRAIFRKLISSATEQYKAEAAARGYLEVEGSLETQYTIKEQVHLTEALAWVFIRAKLPEILERYKILSVEQEETVVVGCTCGVRCNSLKKGCLCNEKGYDHYIPEDHDPACQGICIQSKPDLILQEKATGQVVLSDFKTAYNVTDDTIEEHRDSVQMAVGTLGAELRLGVSIGQYQIQALIKGSRGIFKKKGIDTTGAWKKQYSVLCYARISDPNPPYTKETTWDYKGFWHDKHPVWEATFSQKPEGMSNAEYWVFELPKDILYEQTVEIGPYERPTYMIQQGLNHMYGEELRWIGLLNRLFAAESTFGWANEEFQETLEEEVPRSYACYKYGSRCPVYNICFRGAGWQDPLGFGNYVHRRPHHQPEIDQMVARSIPVPEAIGEVEE